MISTLPYVPIEQTVACIAYKTYKLLPEEETINPDIMESSIFEILINQLPPQFDGHMFYSIVEVRHICMKIIFVNHKTKVLWSTRR